MKAVICDVCKEIVEGDEMKVWGLKNDTYHIEISLVDDKDRCGRCIRKDMNRAALDAHDALKAQRGGTK
jgi:hypothetical protein